MSMKGIGKAAVIFLMLCVVLVCGVHAADKDAETAGDEYYDGLLEDSGAGELYRQLPPETRELLEELELEGLDYRAYAGFDPKRLFALIINIISGKLSSPLKSGLASIGIIMLCAVISGFKSRREERPLDTAISLVSVLSVGTVLIFPVIGCISDVCAAIKLSAGFMLAFIPVMAALIIAAGRPTGAVLYNSLAFTAAQALSNFASAIVTPFIGIYLGINIACAVSPRITLGDIGDIIKNCVNKVLGICGALFSGVLSVQSAVTNAADSVGLKATKYLVSNFVPVIGSALGDTIATVRSCAELVKGTAGAFGILAMLLIYIPVLAEVICWMVILAVCRVCAQTLESAEMVKLLKGVGNALSVLTAVLVFCGAILMFATAVMIRTRA